MCLHSTSFRWLFISSVVLLSRACKMMKWIHTCIKLLGAVRERESNVRDSGLFLRKVGVCLHDCSCVSSLCCFLVVTSLQFDTWTKNNSYHFPFLHCGFSIQYTVSTRRCLDCASHRSSLLILCRFYLIYFLFFILKRWHLANILPNYYWINFFQSISKFLRYLLVK